MYRKFSSNSMKVLEWWTRAMENTPDILQTSWLQSYCFLNFGYSRIVYLTTHWNQIFTWLSKVFIQVIHLTKQVMAWNSLEPDRTRKFRLNHYQVDEIEEICLTIGYIKGEKGGGEKMTIFFIILAIWRAQRLRLDYFYHNSNTAHAFHMKPDWIQWKFCFLRKSSVLASAFISVQINSIWNYFLASFKLNILICIDQLNQLCSISVGSSASVDASPMELE